uniref:Uncharacterized protein n=1 Tax=Anguilla anguilla TaxID=7936 RepID=A0A0E9WI18_ANGAN
MFIEQLLSPRFNPGDVCYVSLFMLKNCWGKWFKLCWAIYVLTYCT